MLPLPPLLLLFASQVPIDLPWRCLNVLSLENDFSDSHSLLSVSLAKILDHFRGFKESIIILLNYLITASSRTFNMSISFNGSLVPCAVSGTLGSKIYVCWMTKWMNQGTNHILWTYGNSRNIFFGLNRTYRCNPANNFVMTI